MNESLYNNFEAVKELNRVDGFDPTKVMRRIVEPMEDAPLRSGAIWMLPTANCGSG